MLTCKLIYERILLFYDLIFFCSCERLYKKTTLIGSGGFGKVFAGKSRLNDDPVAIKMVTKKRVNISDNTIRFL